jgi:hypothetical protein
LAVWAGAKSNPKSFAAKVTPPCRKRAGKALVALAVGILIHPHFAGGAVDQREVTGRKNHAKDPPEQRGFRPNLPHSACYNAALALFAPFLSSLT